MLSFLTLTVCRKSVFLVLISRNACCGGCIIGTAFNRCLINLHPQANLVRGRRCGSGVSFVLVEEGADACVGENKERRMHAIMMYRGCCIGILYIGDRSMDRICVFLCGRFFYCLLINCYCDVYRMRIDDFN